MDESRVGFDMALWGTWIISWWFFFFFFGIHVIPSLLKGIPWVKFIWRRGKPWWLWVSFESPLCFSKTRHRCFYCFLPLRLQADGSNLLRRLYLHGDTHVRFWAMYLEDGWQWTGLLLMKVFFPSLDDLNQLHIFLGSITYLASSSFRSDFIDTAHDISADYFFPGGPLPGWCLKALISVESNCEVSYDAVILQGSTTKPWISQHLCWEIPIPRVTLSLNIQTRTL